MEPIHETLPGAATEPRSDPSLMPAADVLTSCGTDRDRGLEVDEAARRLDHDGPNELVSAPPEPAWKVFARQFADPLVYLLLVATVISLVAWIVEGASGIPVDAVVIVAIVLLNAVVGHIQEGKAADAVAALRDMTTARAVVVRGGERRELPAPEVVVGDLLVLGEGDAVAADARLVAATGLRVQESALTGEAEAVDKTTAPLPEPVGIGDRTCMVFSGTAVAQGTGLAVVTATGMDTEVGAIADMLETTESEPSPLDKEIASVSTMLGIAVIVIAVVVMAVLFLVSDVRSASDAVEILLLGVSLAVAAVPEGLPAILTVVLALGVQKLAAHRAVVKELHSVETLGSASVICSDKTGTLTRNEMTVQRIVTASGAVTLSGTGYAPVGTVTDDATGTAPAGDVWFETRRLLVQGALANEADLQHADGVEAAADAGTTQGWSITGDPTEAAFLVAVRKLDGARDRSGEFTRRDAVPFSSERKMMSVLERDEARDGALRVMSKGAPDVLLGRCTAIQVGHEVLPLDEDRRARVLDTVEALGSEAYRTLGVAWRDLSEQAADPFDEDDEGDLVYVGTVGIIDPPREEAARAVSEAHRAGVRTVMITGDHPITAARIAADLGITDGLEQAVTGARLEAMGADELDRTVADHSVYARVSPEHKLRLVDALQRQGRVVAMTGDGVNDAPALRTADIGVAMGITGTEVTKQASRMILGDDNFATIVDAIRQGRVIFANIKKFLRYLLSSNMGEVITVFLGVVAAGALGLDTAAGGDGGIVVPLLATQILWINLVTDTGPALAMGVDPAVDDPMSVPPRDPRTAIIDHRMWGGILLIGLVMGLATLLTIDMFLPGGLIEGHDSLEVARTAGFTTLVLAQMFNALNSRSETTSAFHHLLTNRLLWGSLLLGAALQVAVVEIPFLQAAFSTASLDLVHWAVCVGMASLVLWVDELRKLLGRHLGPGAGRGGVAAPSADG
jgi:Ca2+-transporting ATPase